MAKNKEVKKKIMPFFKYLSLLMVIITIIVLVLFKFIDILPGEYFLVLCILLFLLTGIFSSLVLTRRGSKRRAFGTFFSIVYIIILVLGIIYQLNTLGFLKKIGFHNYKTENYSVLVLKSNSDIGKIESLENKKIGSLDFNSEGLKLARDKVKKKVKVDFETYNDVGKLRSDFVDGNIDAMLIENSILSILTEDDEDFSKSYNVIHSFSVEVEIEDTTKDVDITKDSFNVYISGIDTYGTVSSVARSDVNMIMSINPKTHKILITSIPRDYYVSLAGKNGKDKLTHAGIYGIDTSIKTIEELIGIKINYYIKINFSSLIKIVDALDGVKVYSKYQFTSRDGYSYSQGYNNLDGERALSFVRERKAFPSGDRVRVENQAAMIEAMIDKAISPAIITNYSELLDTLSSSFLTNISSESITKFIKMQLKDNISWNMENYSLDGSNDYQYTFSYSSSKLYVMMPKQETVINAQNKIKEVLSN